jgi:hypothetical protein
LLAVNEEGGIVPSCAEAGLFNVDPRRAPWRHPLSFFTVPIVSGTLAGVTLTLLIILVLTGRKRKDDAPRRDTRASGEGWEDYLPSGKA